MTIEVPFEGPLDAKIYIAGECPGEKEVMERRPFVGGSGTILNKLLMDVGLIRAQCRLGNVMRVRPPGNNFQHFYQDKVHRLPTPELEEGRKYLLDDIRSVKPNVVLALGNEPLSALMGHRNIDNWRGSILWSRNAGCKVVPTYHPAFLMRQWNNISLALFDFKRAKEESKSKGIDIPTREFILAPTFEQTMLELDRLLECKRVATDIETTMIGAVEIPHLTCISFSDTPLTGICIPFTFSQDLETIDYWATIDEELAVMRKIQELLESEKVEKILQNGGFDITVLRCIPPGIDVKNFTLDTMCAHHTIYSELRKSLAVLCSLYTRQPYYKNWGKTGDDEIYWSYNCMDSAITLECADALTVELEEFGMTEFYQKFVQDLIPVVVDMQIRGTLIDERAKLLATLEYEMRRDELQLKLNTLAGWDVNANSSKQLQQLLYEDMKLPKKIKRTTGNVTTDEEALNSLATKHPSEVFDCILGIRRCVKIVSTYLNDLTCSDGRARCSYLIGGDKDGEGGTDTGRLSSRESIFGSGTNLQNIPPGICRQIFIADPGHLLVEVDLSQAEARVVAYEAEERGMIEAFERGEDIHQLTANSLPPDFMPYGSAYKDIKNPRRLFAKKHVHAFNYGEGYKTFSTRAGIPMALGKSIRSGYLDRFPGIRSWHMKIQSQLSKSKIMVTPLGRKRIFFGRWNEQLFKIAYAYVPQSTVADTLNLAMIRFYNGYRKWPLMLQIHDSFVFQVPEGVYWMEVIVALKHVFDIPITIHGKVLRIPHEVKVGRNWNEMEEVKI